MPERDIWPVLKWDLAVWLNMLKFRERKSQRKDLLENVIHSFSKMRLRFHTIKQSMTNSTQSTTSSYIG